MLIGQEVDNQNNIHITSNSQIIRHTCSRQKHTRWKFSNAFSNEQRSTYINNGQTKI